MSQHPLHSDRAPATEDAPVLDLRRYLRILRKRIWVVAAVVAVGITAAVLYTESKPKVYQATASVVIDPTPPQVFGNQVQEVIQLGAGSYWSNQEYYNTQLEVLVRYDLVARTVDDDCERHGCRIVDELVPPGAVPVTALGGPAGGRERSRDERMALATEMIVGMLSADQMRESRVIKLHVQHTDPALAVDIANRHTRTFLDYHRNLRGESTDEIIDFLDDELAMAARELEASERALLDFKQENDILSVSLEDKQNILAADIARYNAALSDARIQRIEQSTLRDRVKALDGEDIMETPVFALASSGTMVEALKEQYVREKHRLAELSQELGPRHPAYLSQEKKVAEQRQALESEARRGLRELDERYQAALARERQLQGEADRLKAEAFELGRKAVEYNQLARKEQSDEERYQLVLGRLSASKLSRRNTASNVQPHMSAREAVLVYPRLSINVIVAAMVSLMLGLGLAFLLDLLDRTLKSPEDVERTVGAPLLGIIPIVDVAAASDDQARKRNRDLYVFKNPKSPVAEHCRSIRTNILFSAVDRPMRIITVSSPRQAEGKTTSTIYMGTTMAQSGQRVLLVDTDMRKPRLHRSLGASGMRGLSELLLPDTDMDEALDGAIKTTDVPGLYLLPCGKQPPNPAELLLTGRFREVLERLGERFDRVLLDSPPLMLMNDAVVLSRLSDGVIMVAQAGKTSIDDLARSARMLRDVNAPILGVILNDLDVSSGQYGSYYRYGYGYDQADGAAGEDAAPGKAEQTA